MKHIFVVLCFCILNFAETTFYKNNVTDLSKCTIYYSRYGSNYKDFFKIKAPPKLDTEQNDSLTLDFHFSVLAASDAHILLAPSENFNKGDPVYEIVIGAGGNTFCDIRRAQKSAVKESVRKNGLLSALDAKSFWLHISKDGIIEVGQEGSELAFITWTDPDPLPLNVFSFSTWSGIEAKWYFDCPRDDGTTQLEKIRKKMTPLEILRQDLLSQYNPYVRPVINASDFTELTMSLNTYNIILEEHKGIIEIKGVIKMSWQDEKLVWDPSNYSDIQALHIFRREIWHPDFVLYNALGDIRDIFEDSMMIVNNDGMVYWNASMKLKTLCDASLGKWPRDTKNCSFLLGFSSEFDRMKLFLKENESQIGYQVGSNWNVMSVNIYSNKGWDESDLDPALLHLDFELQRKSNTYDSIFFTPYLVITILLLSSFWVSPFGVLKISLGCMQLLLCSILLIGLAIVIPGSAEIPYLVWLYVYCLIGSIISIIIAVVVINLSRNRHKKCVPHFMVKLLTSFPLKTLFCLCVPNRLNDDQYDTLSEHSFKKTDEDQQHSWILLGVTIDRISFLIFLPLIIYVTFISY